MVEAFTKITSDDYAGYRELISHVSEAVWPEFMFHDPVADEHWDGLFEHFPAYQFALIHNESKAVAGIANSVPLAWHEDFEDLPDEGWDWALIKSASDYEKSNEVNLLCGLQISIHPNFQGQGLSGVMLPHMVELARSMDLTAVIIPVRPSLKERYPLTPIDRYISWSNKDGYPYDPWLRVHVRNGGRIIKPCPYAMKVIGRITEWEQWTGLRFFETGDYIIPGALTPVKIDVEDDLGEYIEPNVWIVHPVT